MQKVGFPFSPLLLLLLHGFLLRLQYVRPTDADFFFSVRAKKERKLRLFLFSLCGAPHFSTCCWLLHPLSIQSSLLISVIYQILPSQRPLLLRTSILKNRPIKSPKYRVAAAAGSVVPNEALSEAVTAPNISLWNWRRRTNNPWLFRNSRQFHLRAETRRDRWRKKVHCCSAFVHKSPCRRREGAILGGRGGENWEFAFPPIRQRPSPDFQCAAGKRTRRSSL